MAGENLLLALAKLAACPDKTFRSTKQSLISGAVCTDSTGVCTDNTADCTISTAV
jgi:hypothetical protein